MLRRVLITGIVALTLAAATVGATFTVVPQKGLAGVSLGMSKTRVKQILGAPSRAKHGSNDFGAYTQFFYRVRGIQVSFQSADAVSAVSTTSPKERTAAGIGVGSTEAQVKAKVANVRCRTESGFHHCFVGSFLPGRRVTDFTFRAGHVNEVTVAVVID